MKILLVNKFLYPKGGAETYVFKLGKILEAHGHEVQYFGMQDERNIVGNKINAYPKSLDLKKNSIKNLFSTFKIISSSEARKKIRKVLYDFEPDVVHFNNIHFYLTPSIIDETGRYRKKTKKDLKIIYTAHDYQLICPSHGLFDVNITPCEKCIHGKYWSCFKTKCVKNSRIKSLIGVMEAYHWKKRKAYSYIDTIICPSEFLKRKHDIQERYRNKTVTIHNFIDKVEEKQVEKEGYVLQLGHLSKEKGVYTVLEVCKKMPNVKFVFAGYGEAVDAINKVQNAEYVGFKKGEELELLIRKAALTLCPSQCYENCPFSVIESQMYLTPVVGSNVGGIPELIEQGRTGEIFESGNPDDLEKKIRYILETPSVLQEYTNNCKSVAIETPESYYQKLITLYNGDKNENL